MLCLLCETIFTGGGELYSGKGDEYFHRRSALLLKSAIAGGCQLCTMLQDLLPEHMLTTEWEYQVDVHDDLCSEATNSQPKQFGELSSHVLVPTYHSSKFYSRQWYMGRHGQNGGLKLDSPTQTTNFSLAYFRSDTMTGIPTVEFITVSSAGRTGIGCIFLLRIMFFAQGRFHKQDKMMVRTDLAYRQSVIRTNPSDRDRTSSK